MKWSLELELCKAFAQCLGAGSWMGGGSCSPAGFLTPTCMRKKDISLASPIKAVIGEPQLLQHPSRNPFSFTSGHPNLSTLKHRIMSHGLRAARSKEPSIARSARVWAALLLFGWGRQQCHYCGEHTVHTCRWKVSLLCCCCCLSSRVLGDCMCPERIVW